MSEGKNEGKNDSINGAANEVMPNEVMPNEVMPNEVMPNEVMQYEFPDFFVEYSKEMLRTKRWVIEYMARFGNRLEKGMARMVLAAAGEPWKESR